MRPRRLLCVAGALSALAPLVGCNGGVHRAGEQQVTLHGSYDWNIKGDSLYPQGDGRAENTGVTVGYSYFLDDRLAFKVDATPYRKWRQNGADVSAGELQIGFRYYAWEFDVFDVPIGVFAEIYGGFQHSAKRVPPDGAHTNFTQDTGVGLEARLTDHVSVLTGYRYRHLSHGHVFAGDPNPSQNDNQAYAGVAFTW